MRKLSMDELGRKSINDFKAAEKFSLVVVLENIRSAHNVGSVFRTADAFLLQAIFTTGYTAHPPHKQVTKTALGADLTVFTKHFDNANDAILNLKNDGFKVFAAEQTVNSLKLQQLKFEREEKVAIVFGNEVTGVEQETIQLCDGCIEIPQLGMKHSLNVSVAAGIVLWEFVREKISNESN